MAFSQEGGFVFLTGTGCPDISVGDFCWQSTGMPVDILNISLFILPNPLKFDHLFSSFRIWVNIIHASDVAMSNRPPDIHCLAHMSHIWEIPDFNPTVENDSRVTFVFRYFQMLFISVINQLDAQSFCFTVSFFHASTCFEHMCSSSGGQNRIIQHLASSHRNKWVI